MSNTTTPISTTLANPSGCTEMSRRPLHVYRVKAVDAAGNLHRLTVRAHSQDEMHGIVARLVGSELRSIACMIDGPSAPPAAAQRRSQAALHVVPASTAPRVPRVNLQSAPRPSSFGAPTDLDRALDAADSGLEQQEQRHTPRARRIALGWLIAAAAAGLAVWTAAAIGIGALAAKSDRWPQATRPASSHGSTH